MTRVLLAVVVGLGAIGAVRQRAEAVKVRAGVLRPTGPDGGLDLAAAGLGRRIAGWAPPAATGPARIVAMLWAAPLTAGGLVLAALGGRRPRWDATRGCLVAAPVGGIPAAVLEALGVTANTAGHVVLSRRAPVPDRLLAHEVAHVRQAERLGPLLPIAYVAAQARWGYRANPFEVAARAAAAAGG